jgi:hypothetical protein
MWRFRRAIARVEPAVTPVLVEHATGYWGRPLVRREIANRVVWTIEGVVVLELRWAERGPSTLVVHDFSLLDPLRKAIRTRHVSIRLATARDLAG